MKKIIFKDKTAQQIYDDYFRRMEKSISVLSPNDRRDMLMELNSHFYEGLQQSEQTNEMDIILRLTEKLGLPEDVSKSLIAEKKANPAIKTFHPKPFFRAVVLNIHKGGIFIIVALSWLFSATLFLTVITKLIFPKQTGLFVENGHFMQIGFSSSAISGKEVLGNWYIVLALLAIIVFYFVAIALLRLARKKTTFHQPALFI